MIINTKIIMRKITTFLVAMQLCIILVNAQKLIPFQYQNKSKWDYQTKWGLMTADRKIVLPPTYYTIAPATIEENYMFLGNKIIEINTGKIIWDSTEAKNVAKIVGNIVSIKMPLRGAYNYQPYSFKNIKTRKLVAEEGRFANKNGFVITEGAGEEGVVDENGKVIIEKKKYQKISDYLGDFFVAINDYDSYKNIYDVKGNKLNSTSYSEIKFGYGKTSLIVANRLVDKTKGIYELIFINPMGKEVGQRLYFVKGNESIYNKLQFAQNGFVISTREALFFSNKECDEVGKIMNPILVNLEGKLIINSKSIVEIKEVNENLFMAKSDDLKTIAFFNKNGIKVFTSNNYKNISVLNENLFFASDTTDNKKYFLNSKGERQVNGAGFSSSNLVRDNNAKGFVIYKSEINKLFFNTYNIANGTSKFGEQFKLEEGIKLNEIITTNGKYYLLNIADNNKKQYATYIYDIEGKLVQKSEDGLWIYSEGLFIKYTINTKGDRMYIGYYDSELKPFSIIQE